MIDDTIAKIETHVRGLNAVSDEKKDELISLFGKLRSEVSALSETQSEHAETIARFVELSAREATRTDGNSALRQVSLDGLSASVDGFEASHPRLVQIVNAICMNLSNLGI